MPAHIDLTHHDNNNSTASCNPLQPNFCREGWFSDTCDRVLLQVGSIGCKLRSRALIFILKAHAVPVVSKTGILPLPILQKCDGYGEDVYILEHTCNLLPQKDMKTA